LYCTPGCSQTHNPPASASQVLGLQPCPALFVEFLKILFAVSFLLLFLFEQINCKCFAFYFSSLKSKQNGAFGMPKSTHMHEHHHLMFIAQDELSLTF
jgi:hypothetical protein